MRNSSATRVVFGGAMMAAVSGLALACPPCDDATTQAGEGVWVGSFDEHLGDGTFTMAFTPAGGAWVGEEGGVWSLSPAAQPETKEEIVIFEENGKRRVIHNGKELSDEEAVKLHEHLRELHAGGAHGHAGSEIEISIVPEVHEGEVRLATRLQNAYGQAVAQPKVMLGITMAEPGEALRVHLDLGDRPVIMINGVIEGLPAAEAGLKRYDIIVGIDDSDDQITAERLHEILSKKTPGEELRLRVVRGGQKETYRLKLLPYDAKRLGIEPQPLAGGAVLGEREHVESAEKAEHMARLKEMTQRLRESGLDEGQIAQVQRQVEQALQQALRHGQEAVAASRVAPGANGSYEFVVPGPDGRMFELKVPDMSSMEVPEALREHMARFGGESSDLDARLSELEQRMDEMSAQFEARMEKTLQRFEELTERLERRLGDGG